MAQANYVPTLRHAQITGVTGEPSTNPIRTAHQDLLRWLPSTRPTLYPSMLTAPIWRAAQSICTTF
jgi:hypothetical protein